MSAHEEYFARKMAEIPPEFTTADHAQYIADHIDASIMLQITRGIDRDAAFAAAPEYLETEGWAGRRYEFVKHDDGSAWWPKRIIRETPP